MAALSAAEDVQESEASVADNEISVSSEGVSLKGGVVDDLRPVIRKVAGTADSVLTFVDNVVGIPLDYLNRNLGRFRQKYKDEFDAIPDERRQEPSMRVACAVVRGAAFSADEPEIQEMFANLLAAASDSARARAVHPGFVTVIGDLRPLDAHVLAAYGRGLRGAAPIGEFESLGINSDDVSQAISNLVRLGLLDWKPMRYDDSDLTKLSNKQYPMRMTIDNMHKFIVDVVREVQQLKIALRDTLKVQHARQQLELTTFGRNFLASVLSPKTTDDA